MADLDPSSAPTGPTPPSTDGEPAATSVFEVHGLCKRYGDRVVLDQLDFEVERGECLVILGRSGVGKSVTLRQLNGLEKPDAGRVVFDGVEITDLDERRLIPIRRRVAMLFQGGALFDSMSVHENIAFPLREHTRMREEEIARTVARKLAMVELEGIEEKMPAALSGGMKKRVALARSLALDPEVVLFDEPTTGLDPVTSGAIARLIRSTQRRLGVTAVVVTHDMVLTREVADRLAFLEDGRFCFVGSWEEARASRDPLVSGFLTVRLEEDRDVVH